MTQKEIEQNKDQAQEGNDYLKNQDKAYEEALEDMLLQEHSPEEDLDVNEHDIENLESISEEKIDQDLEDGFQAEDLDKFFPDQPDKPSERFNKKANFIKENLIKSVKDSPDLAKTRSMIEKSLENKTTDWLIEQNRQINETNEKSKEETDSVAKTVAITGLKLVPFAGPISDISEGIVGKDMYGNKLESKQRVYKVIEGGIFLAIDSTGYGVIATEGVRASKLITRSAALLRKLKISPRIYKPLYKTGVMIKKNKSLARMADVTIDTIRANNRIRKDKGIESLKPLLNVTETDHEAIDIAREIPEYQKHIDEFNDKHGLKEHEVKKEEHKSKADELLSSIEGGEVG